MSTELFNQVLKNLKLDAKCVNFYKTSSSNFYDIELGHKTTLNKFSSSVADIQFRLRTKNPLFVQILPEEGIIRVQDLKDSSDGFFFSDLINNSKIKEDNFILGKDYYDNIIETNFTLHPHTLIAGATGSGKSVALHNIVCNALLQKNYEIYLSDAKGVEFEPYYDLPQVKMLVSTFDHTLRMMNIIHSEMEQRFKIIKCFGGSNYKDISGINPLLVVIDEISDLILQDKDNKFKEILLKISQKSRASGIFIVAATQRPSVDILSGPIKANFPARIALKTASVIDSKVILDHVGAESLKGKGDAIIKNDQYSYTRFKFPFIDPRKILPKLIADKKI